MSEQRLSDLEARFAWLERHVGEQDRAMLGLTDELRRLREELVRLRQRHAVSPEEGASGSSEARPPHY